MLLNVGFTGSGCFLLTGSFLMILEGAALILSSSFFSFSVAEINFFNSSKAVIVDSDMRAIFPVNVKCVFVIA
ncbi:hypothetical protein F050043D4_51370 [Bacteroides thetaiotaomicron]